MQIDLETLGLDKEKLADMVVERVAERLLSGYDIDEGGEAHSRPSRFQEALQAQIKERINSAVDDLASKHVLPKLQENIDNLVLQETSRWGEKVAPPKSFVEYMVERAENYIREEVDFQGKNKEQGGYNWSKKTTRISFIINSHLQYHIENAVKQALAGANAAIVGGLEGAVKVALQNATAALKVAVTSR